ncbi:MAG TPA: bifunctional glutamate N-acetyltransferase/amino-acid acetyltransferase ArgJ [Fibrobacteria bacterium]|nr:bifunctional glutamate N-acetyltransferase/amino-acid acetyltransferase ArgJ [Fibrobacteria bacterium]
MQDVSFPKGFTAAGVAAGIKKNGNPDVGLLRSEPPARAFGAFTRNAAAAAPVRQCREVLASGESVAFVLVNSGCANAATGERGYKDSLDSAARVKSVTHSQGSVLVSSTGVIGEPLPMEALNRGIDALAAGKGEAPFHRAIMTTDTFPKVAEMSLSLGGREVRLGGAAKGAGMICPNMATMLAYLTTDIALPAGYRDGFLEVVDRTFNSISVDGDMSTNDTVILLANGASGVEYAGLSPADKELFDGALRGLMGDLARAIVRDGEGATKLIAVEVFGARSEADARAVGRAVSNSPLVKTAFFGGDANWGRVLAAAGYSGAVLEMDRLSLEFCGVKVFEKGLPLPRDEKDLAERMKAREVSVKLDLGIGSSAWTYWTCDLSYEYVKINGDYRS